MEKLIQFTETIRSVKSSSVMMDQPVTAAAEVESYHGQLMEVDEDEYSYDPPDLTGMTTMTTTTKPKMKELDGWFVGKLKCKRHIDDSYRDTVSNNTGDGRRVDDYAVIDPRKK